MKVSPVGRCPDCEHYFDRSTALNASDDEPDAGDISLCIACGAVLSFTTEGYARIEDVEGSDWGEKLPKESVEIIKEAQAKIRAFHNE